MRLLSPTHPFWVACAAISVALWTVPSADAHAPGPTLSGFGTPVVDGVLGPGEWDAAARFAFPVNVPPNDGGGTTPATLFVMNDGANLYIALELVRSGPPSGSFTMEFDNDHDGVPFEEGDDAFVANGGVAFFDNFRSMQPPCPANVVCGFGDTQAGGATNGRSVGTGNGTVQVFEVERPLDSADDLHDFSLAPGSTVGYFTWIRIFSLVPACNFGPSCTADTRTPPFDYGDIVISAGPNTAPELEPETISVELVEEHETETSVSVRNPATRVLELSVGEAADDCSIPGDVEWLTVPAEPVTVGAGAAADIPISIDSSGLSAPDLHTAKVCIGVVDGTVLELPVILRVQFPFSGFLATFENPPVLNAAHSDGVQTFWFRLGGDRGLDVVSEASSRQIDCSTGAALGPAEPAETPSWTGLSYQHQTARYAYPWKTTPAVKSTCRELALTLSDASVHTARLHFVK